jgi:hypothetical protein
MPGLKFSFPYNRTKLMSDIMKPAKPLLRETEQRESTQPPSCKPASSMHTTAAETAKATHHDATRGMPRCEPRPALLVGEPPHSSTLPDPSNDDGPLFAPTLRPALICCAIAAPFVAPSGCPLSPTSIKASSSLKAVEDIRWSVSKACVPPATSRKCRNR